MKHFIISTAIIFLVSLNVSGQTSKLSLTNNIQEIVLSDIPADIIVRGTSNRDIIISLVNTNTEEHDKSASSTIDATGLSARVEGNRMILDGRKAKSIVGRYIIDMPAGLSLQSAGSSGNGKLIKIAGVKGKIDIQTENNIEIDELENGLIIKNTSGDIKVKTGKRVEGAISIITQKGNVDFTMHRNLGVELKLGSGTGKVIARKLSNKNKGEVTMEGTAFNTSLNGGGTVVQIQSLSGMVKVFQYR